MFFLSIYWETIKKIFTPVFIGLVLGTMIFWSHFYFLDKRIESKVKQECLK